MMELLRNRLQGVVLNLSLGQLTPARAASVLIFLLSTLSGCAFWVQVEGPFRVDSQGYAVDLPAGWWRATAVENPLLLTKDGVSLQYISIEQVVVGDELPQTKKKFAKGMSPQHVAEVELDEARSEQGSRNFEQVENVPFQVAGLPGFKLVYTVRNATGLRLKRVHYGFLVRDRVYRIQYQAAARYYFDKDLTTFERVCDSFRILGKD